MRRTMMAAAATALVMGAGVSAQAAQRPHGAQRSMAAAASRNIAFSPGDGRVLGQVNRAQVEFIRHDYDAALEALKPELVPTVFATLSPTLRYQVMGLYARSLYGLSDWDEAHEAFIDLTNSPRATAADWLLRLDTAARVGDADDVALAHDRLQDAGAAAADDDDASPAA